MAILVNPVYYYHILPYTPLYILRELVKKWGGETFRLRRAFQNADLRPGVFSGYLFRAEDKREDSLLFSGSVYDIIKMRRRLRDIESPRVAF